MVPFRRSKLQSAPEAGDVISDAECLAFRLFLFKPESWASLFRVCFQLASGAIS